ncbi:hypothetical protein SEEM41H_20333, partial [Salmonella enterica subsp. enterica serovar Montevideo str. 4441 H]
MIARFIPAGAGNTRNSAQTSIASAVYPRWRGEHLIQCVSGLMRAGLSPLARGTLLNKSAIIWRPRFIPRWRGEHMLSRVMV